MSVYTITINTEEDDWVFQENGDTPEEAFSKAIAGMPFDDTASLSQDDENLLVDIANGLHRPELIARENQVGIWSWNQGWALSIPMYCHIIKTETSV